MKLIAAAFAIVAAQAVAAAPADDQRASFEARYLSLRTAMDSRDPQAIAALLTPDFTSVDVDGASSDLPAMLAELKLLPRPTAGVVRKTTVLAVRPTGDGADVDQQYERTDPSGGTIPRLVTRSTDHWVGSGDHWRLQRTATTDVAIYRDGVLLARKTAG